MSIAELKAARAAANAQAQRMLDVVRSLDPTLLDQLRIDPIAVLTNMSGLDVEFADLALQTSCSVAGSYHPELDPKLVRITRASSRRREQFTALHEYGHHLQQTVDLNLGAHVLDATYPRFEELACEAFAARVLLPDEIVAPLTTAKGTDAESIKRFFEHSEASRTACCVRGLDFLVGGGTIALLDEEGRVQFAVASSMFPPAKGSDQSATPLIARALTQPGELVTHDATHIAYSSHNGTTLYGQACWVDGWLVAVMKTDNVPWKPFAPTRTQSGSPRANTLSLTTHRWLSCETCEEGFEAASAERCGRCQQPKCSQGHCPCTVSSEVQCSRCHYAWHRARFRDPNASQPVCRDCE